MTNSNTLETDSTSNTKGFLHFWDKSCQEILTYLWSLALTSSRGLVATFDSGYANKKISNSWFCAEQTYLPNQKWRTWIAASRWCYNQSIAILKTEKIGKYDLRKRIMDSAPNWVSQQPYNPRQLAVFKAYQAYKTACQSKCIAKFRSSKSPFKTIRF